MVTFPYIKGTINSISKILKKRGITVAFAPPKYIRRFVDFAKYLMNQRQLKGVYEVPFSCGKVYIGETGRSMKTHLKEHYADIICG